jgi:hypothetical protein
MYLFHCCSSNEVQGLTSSSALHCRHSAAHLCAWQALAQAGTGTVRAKHPHGARTRGCNKPSLCTVPRGSLGP